MPKYQKWFRRWFNNPKQQEDSQEKQSSVELLPVYPSIQDNLTFLKNAFGHSSDLQIQELTIGKSPTVRIGIAYIDSLVNADKVMTLIKDLLGKELTQPNETHPHSHVRDWIKENLTVVGDMKEIRDWNRVSKMLLSGHTVVFVDGTNQAVSGDTSSVEHRAVTEPKTQIATKGPNEGFTESLRTNISLIRKRIKSPNLRVKKKPIGQVTRTDVALLYMEGIANPKVVKEVKKRLENINTDKILDTGEIGEWIEDQKFTLFPTLVSYERPDSIVSHLAEGRVAILVDGTPYAIAVPVTFLKILQSAEDYFMRYDLASVLRLLRIVAFMISLYGSAMYIALTAFHQEMLPTSLLISIGAQRQGVPFPVMVEALLMEGTFEILREAAVRAPRALGQPLAIMGAVVIGETAVVAGLVSPIMVIVVAITGISSYVAPEAAVTITSRILRFGFMLISGVFGLYGILLVTIAMVAHMQSLRSFGVPYLAPISPLVWSDLKDSVVRLPHWMLSNRPHELKPQRLWRIKYKVGDRVEYDD
ncbi:spore germination protein KA [Marinithermofilum abyssi]|uniref:Spore germination protein KA n=1 Tax=Marinithermofilum abyssi TaxID=1571185 RepID=A0A8J2YAG0_9BACL|nr:spore germination protein [Marinithermofilum abyssi]GGE29163.1 spore germination protein KA [Marinithermofilum abyssi]